LAFASANADLCFSYCPASVHRRSGSNNLHLPGASTLAGEEHLPIAATREPPLFVALRFVQFSRNAVNCPL
ncbi:hypothetical protein ABEV13_03805, partial [Geobacillus stearothermophilus]|uniref:hypothetical protein n=1 Tax=Geobacillus stearothermophilus TaxID=1422 RepID=UPI003D25BC8A